MVQVPTNEAAAPEVVAPETVQVQAPAETKKQRKAREAAEKKAAAEAAAAANPPADGTAPVVETQKPKGEHGVARSKDVPWSNRKIAVLSTLKALGATSPTSAKSAKQVVEAAVAAGHTDVVSRDVRHYCYHGAAGGLTGITDKLPEGTPGGGYGFYLTTLGLEQDYPALSASLVKPVKAAPAAPATTVPTEAAPEAPAAS